MFVGDQTPRFFPLAFQDLAEEAFSRSGVATWPDEDIAYISVLINGPPQVVLASADLDEYFVDVPSLRLAPPALC